MLGTVLKRSLTQFVLAVSLFCNPMVALAAAAAETLDAAKLAMMQMPCHSESMRSQLDIHDSDGIDGCSMGCCQDDDCSMFCRTCLDLHFVNAMLLGAFEFYFPYPLQQKSEIAAGYFTDRSILPEIQPPVSSHHSWLRMRIINIRNKLI